MCFGPIKFCPSIAPTKGATGESIVLIAGFDLIEIDGDFPHIASLNEYDFYFLAREAIAEDSKVLFWFPFAAEIEDPHYKEAGSIRRQRFLSWQVTTQVP